MGINDSALFRDMAGTIDFVHRQVLRVFSLTVPGTITDVTLFPNAKNAHPRLFADRVFPYSVELTGMQPGSTLRTHFGGQRRDTTTTRKLLRYSLVKAS